MKKKRKRGRPLGTKNRDKLIEKLKYIEPEKAKIIRKIQKLEPKYYETLDINYAKFTLDELEKYLQSLNKSKREKKIDIYLNKLTKILRLARYKESEIKNWIQQTKINLINKRR